jgi:hypothetical protein
MSRGSQIVLLLAVAGLAVGSYRTAAQAPRATELKLKDGKAKVESTLSQDDPVDVAGGNGAPCKAYAARFAAGKTYRIDMMSKDLDSFLRLEAPNGKKVAEDDDGGEDRDARITYRCTKAGTYRIVATTIGPLAMRGDFALAIQEKASAKALKLALRKGKGGATGKLSNADPERLYAVELSANHTYRIDMKSQDLDSFLRLEGPDGDKVAEDDDSGEELDARIVYRCTRAGTYHITATTAGPPGNLGAFELTIEGRPLPRPIKLALRKGKVRIAGALSKEEPSKFYALQMAADHTYRIDLLSEDLCSCLRLEGPDGKTVAGDDDLGDGLGARIIYRCTRAGAFRIEATAEPLDMGAFVLAIQEEATAKPIKLELRDGKACAAGTLSRDDPERVYAVELVAGRTYRIDMMSTDLDSSLRLEGPDGKTVADDEDRDGLDPRITYRCTRAGTYRIVAAVVGRPDQSADYTLTIQRQPGAKVGN